MLQIEEWFRRPQRKVERKVAPVTKAAAPAVHRTEEKRAELQREPETPPAPAGETGIPQAVSPPAFAGEAKTAQAAAPLASVREAGIPQVMPAGMVREAAPEAFTKAAEEPDRERRASGSPAVSGMTKDKAADVPDILKPEEAVSLQDSVAETDEIDQITEKIGLDVSGMLDMEKEDFLLQQIDEFREKAKQLQQLMLTRESKAKALQSVVDEKEAQASELDDLINVRQGEADRIMGNVAEKIDAMSSDVRQEMTGLSDTVSREVTGLSQNLANEITQSTEKTRQAVETATQNMIDQNTRSLEGLREQLEQLGHLEQIGELSTEMNSQIITLKSDIVEKIHSEDVKCYRNIQASLEEQSKLLSGGDEKTREYMQEQMDDLELRMGGQAKLLKVSLGFAVLNFLGIIGILVCVILL